MIIHVDYAQTVLVVEVKLLIDSKIPKDKVPIFQGARPEPLWKGVAPWACGHRPYLGRPS